jgi:hypothetical protein
MHQRVVVVHRARIEHASTSHHVLSIDSSKRIVMHDDDDEAARLCVHQRVQSLGMCIAARSRMDQTIIPRPPVVVAVVARHGQHCVVTTAPVKRGQVVLAIDGPTVSTPTRYTVQVGEGQHVDAEARTDGGFPIWRFLNHACEPNTRLIGRALTAVRDLPVGQEVSFDYDSTEWDMAAPFECGCGSPKCRGTVRGFRHLSDEQRAQLIAIAPHLQAELARAGRELAGARRRSS